MILTVAACGIPASSSPSESSSAGESGESSLVVSSSETSPQDLEEKWRHNGGYAYAYYPQLGREVMPIGAWCAPPAPYGAYTQNQVTLENYRTLSESGINSVYALYDQAQNTPDIVLDALDYCEEFGLVYLVRDLRMLAAGQEPELLDFFDAYLSKPAYGGNLIVDEPGTKQFEEIGALNRTWKSDERTKDKMMYVNMLPSYAGTNQLLNGAGGGNLQGEISYTEYIDKYLEEVKPPMFSFDFYPFNGHNTNFGKGYFQQIYDVKTRVEKAGIPFWTFAQVGYYDGTDTRRMPESELLWQVNTALSCGAKGIQYFNYWHPYEIQGNNAGFVGKDGTKLYLYEYGVKANRQIAAVDEILMKSANLGVIQAGESPDEIPAEAKLTSFRSLTGVSGGDALIGCFDYRGKTAFYVTANSLTQTCTVTLHFSDSATAKIIVNAVNSEKTGGSLTLTLAPGEGGLIVID